MRVVNSGLSADDTYILTGAQFAIPGMKVNAVPEGQPPTPPAEPNAPQTAG